MQTVTEWFLSHPGFPPQLAVTLISMLPILELRAGIPLARMAKLPLEQAIFFSVLGNVIPIPVILLFIEKIFNWMRPMRFFGKIVKAIEKRAMNKSESIKTAEFWGIVFFVGIPLPGTGGWTGALIASMLKVELKKAAAAIALGIAIAATIMSFISYGVFHM